MNRKKRGRRMQATWTEYATGYLFMLPWIAGFLLFMAFPLGWSLHISFHKVRLGAGGLDYLWVGFTHYRTALAGDPVFPIDLLLFFQQVVLMLPIILIFALCVSLLLVQRFPGRFLFRAIFFLPVIFATGQVLTELFNQGAGDLPFLEQYGVSEWIARTLPPNIAKPLDTVLESIVIILWYSGIQILIFVAGCQTIPAAIYEAVRIDGASPWESFWKITLPGLLPFMALNSIYTIVDLFTFPFNPVMGHVANHMFRSDTGMGYASALAWIYFALILLLIGAVIGCFRAIDSKIRA